MNLILSRIAPHISSISLVILYTLVYLMNDDMFTEYLPENGKPLALLTLASVVVLFELYVHGYRHINQKLSDLSDQIAISNLKQAVNALYNRFIQSGDEYITNEYTIKELAELKDLRDKYKVNSYTQDRLHFLCSRIKRK